MLTFIFFIWKTKTKGRNLPHLTHIKGSLYFVKPQLCQKGWLTPLQTQTVSLRSCYLSPCGLCWLCVLSGRSKSELHQVWGPRCHVGSPGDAGAAWAFVQSTWEWSYTWTVGLMAKQKWTYWVDKTFFSSSLSLLVMKNHDYNPRTGRLCMSVSNLSVLRVPFSSKICNNI